MRARTLGSVLRPVLGWASLGTLLLTTGAAHAYPQFSQNDDATNCRACHGDFRSNNYTSLSDGQGWGSLHNLHRQTMVSGDCDTCHGNSNFPVLTNASTGGDGLAALGCMGCHGRAEDNTNSNPEFPNGYGAGLRQHHFVNGTTICANCHGDADPGNYTTVGEDVLPPYYQTPGNNHPNMPVDSCNPNGTEDFAGSSDGLDNDGDDAYDGADSDCSGQGGSGGSGTGGSGGSGTGGSATGGNGGSGTGGSATGGAGTGGAGTGGAGTGGTTSSGTGGTTSSGSNADSPEDDGGCGCRFERQQQAPSGALGLALLAMGGLLARRRRDGRR